jgi:alpha-galactosidase
MGWSTWNYFGLKVKKPPTDAIIRAEAEAMVNSGMQAVGYTYVNIDDEWQAAERDSHGNIQPNAQNFPNGMAALAEYVHGLGLKIGIYTSPAKKTCSGHIGSYGHVQQDANTFASWGMDYLKYDWCGATGSKPETIKAMYDALQATNRPFVYSISEYGIQQPWTWAAKSGATMWRTGEDVKDDFFEMVQTALNNNGLQQYAGTDVGIGGTPGWNDPDMLQVGNGGMAVSEYRIQMSLWSIMAAPLIAGNDLTQLLNKNNPQEQQYLQLLTDPDIIAVDQDSAGAQGYRVWQQGPEQIWKKPMADGSTVVGVFNLGLGSANVSLPFTLLGLSGTVDAYDLWAEKDLGNIQTGYVVVVDGLDAMMLKLTPQK